jgi:AcrR family transcriptional regulator
MGAVNSCAGERGDKAPVPSRAQEILAVSQAVMRNAHRSEALMTLDSPNSPTAAKTKLSRAERNDETKRKLFHAAAKVVGRLGYAEASVARITELAEVAQGTFYNHFENRQELLDDLLPALGLEMLEFIQERTLGVESGAAKEDARFRAFFEFLQVRPEFLRILNEAEVYAPKGYHRHTSGLAISYMRSLKRGRLSGLVDDFSDDELEAIVHILMGARNYLSQRYAYGPDGSIAAVPEHVFTAYRKLMRGGLFAKPKAAKRRASSKRK